ncbi:hypothetical protein ACV37K_32745, partial [Pseudomonas aeruginosa]
PLARGRFAGTEADFAWVVAHAPNSAALCDEYEDCRCDLWSADARVPPKPLGSCTGAVLSVLGGLDDSGREPAGCTADRRARPGAAPDSCAGVRRGV